MKEKDYLQILADKEEQLRVAEEYMAYWQEKYSKAHKTIINFTKVLKDVMEFEGYFDEDIEDTIEELRCDKE